MSSTSAQPPSTTVGPGPVGPSQSGGAGGGGNALSNNGVSSSLYLFTFLITIVVLGLISAGLLFRAYYIRRRFQQRVEEAIRAGQPLPPDAALALGLTRPRQKKEKKVGPMPGMWEAEMLLDREAGRVEEGWSEEAEMEVERGQGRSMSAAGGSAKWDEFTPLSVIHFTDSTPETSHEPEYILPPPRHHRYLPSWVPVTNPLPRPAPERSDTAATIPRLGPAYLVPPPGEEVTVGVLIALPFEEKVDDLWVRRQRWTCRRCVWGSSRPRCNNI